LSSRPLAPISRKASAPQKPVHAWMRFSHWMTSVRLAKRGRNSSVPGGRLRDGLAGLGWEGFAWISMCALCSFYKRAGPVWRSGPVVKAGPWGRKGPRQRSPSRPASCRVDVVDAVANDLQNWTRESSKMRMQMLCIPICRTREREGRTRKCAGLLGRPARGSV